MNLYQLNDKYLTALATLDVNEDGEIIGGEVLKELQDERDVKALSYAKLIRMLNAEVKEIKEEESRLKAMRTGLQNKIDWLKSTLEGVVQPGEKFKDMHASIYWMTTETLEVSNIDDLPQEFIKVTVEPMKDAIKRAIKSGGLIHGVELVQKQALIVK